MTGADLPTDPGDPRQVTALAEEWGVQRQVDDLLAALRRQTDEE